MVHQPNILVFDSGIGGVSIYHDIRQKIPQANYIYAFDNQAFPYGNKSNTFLLGRVNLVINKLLSMHHIDIIVIACNTASTICLSSLRESIPCPIVGVVPAIKSAINLTHNGCIGLLATKATIEQPYVHQLIDEFAKGYRVEMLGIPELAIIAEQKLQGKKVDSNKLKVLMKPWLAQVTVPDTIVLGCTHYPFIADELKTLFPNSLFVDSAAAIAARVYDLLKNQYNFDITLSTMSVETPNLVYSTAYDDATRRILETLQKYNLMHYQTINLSHV